MPSKINWSVLEHQLIAAIKGVLCTSQQSSPNDSKDRVTLARTQFLREWRQARARVERVPHYRIFNNRTLEELSKTDPSTVQELSQVSGIGQKKLGSWAISLLDALGHFRQREQGKNSEPQLKLGISQEIGLIHNPAHDGGRGDLGNHLGLGLIVNPAQIADAISKDGIVKG